MAKLSELRQTTERQQGTLGLDSAQVVALGGSGGVTVYDSLNLLPVSSLTAGDEAYVKSNNRYYISNGSGWYNAALVNAAPYWDSEPLSSYDIADSATPLIITAKALDSDNPDTILVNQSSGTDSAQYLVNITNDSSVWTFTPKSQDSINASVTAGDLTDSNLNDFIYTFKWSDGISFVSKAVTINYNFLTFTEATGGTTNTYTLNGINYKSHTFLSGTTNFIVSKVGTNEGATVDLLLIGGGGGGGGGYNNDACGGGGGAGAFLQTTGHSISVQSYSIVVGAGGAGGSGSGGGGGNGRSSRGGADGYYGANTTAFGYTANGGGSGTSYQDMPGWNNGNASCGGAGGAGGKLNNSGSTQLTAGTYGNQGGTHNGTGQSNNSASSGGGGGAGSAGGNGTSNNSGGNGGSGSTNNYRTGSDVTYAGGGGGGHGGSGKTAASGGSGGGGNAGSDNGNGVAGTANTGGGGGGASSDSVTVNGGAGGSGIVVVRYRVA